MNSIRLRHPNGNGSVYDQSEADGETYLSRKSELLEDSDVFTATITDSIVRNSFIYKARVHNSIVSNSLIAGDAQIFNSTVSCELIAGTPSIDYSDISGLCRIWGNPTIYNVSIKDLSVFGNAVLLGDWTFDGKRGRIGLGVWHEPPRVVRYEDLQITITESIPGYAYVGCRLHEINWWFKIGDRIGAAANWTPEQVLRLRNLFREWTTATNTSERKSHSAAANLHSF